MFEVGTKYEFIIVREGSDESVTGRVVEYNHPLVRLADTPAMRGFSREIEGNFVMGMEIDPDAPPVPGQIINVTSIFFVSARRVDGD